MKKPFEEALNELLADYNKPDERSDVISGLELALMAQREQAQAGEESGANEQSGKPEGNAAE